MNIGSPGSLKLMCHDRNKGRSNLPFQITLYLNLWLFPPWFLMILINLDARFHTFTNGYKWITVAAFLMLLMSESVKVYLGYLGNLAGKIPELACCWLILTFIQLPLELFVLFDRTLSSSYGETFVSFLMVCLLFSEIVTGTIALLNLADHRAKMFYLKQLYDT